MAKFRIELDDGRKFEIEADTQPSASDVTQFIGGRQAAKGQTLIPEAVSAVGRGIERGAEELPEGLRTPVTAALGTAQEAIKGGAVD